MGGGVGERWWETQWWSLRARANNWCSMQWDSTRQRAAKQGGEGWVQQFQGVVFEKLLMNLNGVLRRQPPEVRGPDLQKCRCLCEARTACYGRNWSGVVEVCKFIKEENSGKVGWFSGTWEVSPKMAESLQQEPGPGVAGFVHCAVDGSPGLCQAQAVWNKAGTGGLYLEWHSAWMKEEVHSLTLRPSQPYKLITVCSTSPVQVHSGWLQN